MRFPRTILGLVAGAAATALTLGALVTEPIVRGELAYPLGPLEGFRGGAFTVDPSGPPVNLHEVAARARSELPDSVVLVFDTFDDEDRSLVIGPVADDWNLDRLVRWRDTGRLPLLGPDPIGLGRSKPDFFSAPRRGHDLAVAAAAIALVAAAWLVIVAARRHVAAPAASAAER